VSRSVALPIRTESNLKLRQTTRTRASPPASDAQTVRMTVKSSEQTLRADRRRPMVVTRFAGSKCLDGPKMGWCDGRQTVAGSFAHGRPIGNGALVYSISASDKTGQGKRSCRFVECRARWPRRIERRSNDRAGFIWRLPMKDVSLDRNFDNPV
jgi:hypothetical protein